MIDQSRRQVLRSGLLFAVAPGLLGATACSSRNRNLELQQADENGIMLPPGFSSRVIARSGQTAVAGGRYSWHDAPDGGECIVDPSDPEGWIYISNSEINADGGGAGAIRFDASGEVMDAYPILRNTSRNCAGGLTPWGSWLSCEEVDHGRVWECDPTGTQPASVRPAMGRFNHEAVATDPVNRKLYLTEDKPDGGLYRFTPNTWGDLSSGLLEVATEKDVSSVGIELDWEAVPDPDASGSPTRYQLPDMVPFAGGEGIVYFQGQVYFTTKGDNSVWQLDLASSLATRLYDDDDYAEPVLTGVDNITVDAAGRLYVAEDGGDMQVVMLTLSGNVVPVAQVIGQNRSEIAGVAFSPDGSRLYFSSQRGKAGVSSDGVTYEISGPFDAL